MLNNKATLKEVMTKRRSTRTLVKKENFDKKIVEEILKQAMYVPSAFNMQSYRIIALSGKESDALWDIVEGKLLEKLGQERFDKTNQSKKMQGFRGGNGTLLFFEDLGVVEEKGNIAKSYKEDFPSWSDQGSGMIQYAVWLLLTAEGLSASLQHYHTLIEDDVRKRWDVPSNWRLMAQMPYGINAEEIKDRAFIKFEELARFED